MKALTVLTVAFVVAGAAEAQTQVGVSIGINQPGVYGRIDIGNYPPPAVILPQPVVIAPSPVAIHQRPIYLYVPPAHQHDWGRYCSSYRACGQPVYFVREDWVRERYDEEHRHGKDKGKGHGNDKGKGHGHKDHD
jgi:hypothetical protein